MVARRNSLTWTAVLLLVILGCSNAITLKLNNNNKKMCFYIKGENVDSEFVLNYGYSGNGYENCRTRVDGQ